MVNSVESLGSQKSARLKLRFAMRKLIGRRSAIDKKSGVQRDGQGSLEWTLVSSNWGKFFQEPIPSSAARVDN